MAQGAEIVFHREQRGLERPQAGREERWPFTGTALLVVGSSALLWSLIISGAIWLMG